MKFHGVGEDDLASHVSGVERKRMRGLDDLSIHEGEAIGEAVEVVGESSSLAMRDSEVSNVEQSLRDGSVVGSALHRRESDLERRIQVGARGGKRNRFEAEAGADRRLRWTTEVGGDVLLVDLRVGGGKRHKSIESLLFTLLCLPSSFSSSMAHLLCHDQGLISPSFLPLSLIQSSSRHLLPLLLPIQTASLPRLSLLCCRDYLTLSPLDDASSRIGCDDQLHQGQKLLKGDERKREMRKGKRRLKT